MHANHFDLEILMTKCGKSQFVNEEHSASTCNTNDKRPGENTINLTPLNERFYMPGNSYILRRKFLVKTSSLNISTRYSFIYIYTSMVVMFHLLLKHLVHLPPPLPLLLLSICIFLPSTFGSVSQRCLYSFKVDIQHTCSTHETNQTDTMNFCVHIRVFVY